MSPTEDQLRAALQQGQGPGIDADAVISRAHAVRHERRVKFGSIAAVVAVVAGIGVVGGIALGSGPRHPSNASAGLGANAPVAASGAAGSGVAGSGVAGSRAAAQGASQPRPSGNPAADGQPFAGAPAPGAAACPARAPQLTIPNTAGTSLFDGSVSSMTICVFPETGGPALESGGHPVSTVLNGSAAAQLAASLDSASKTTQPGACPLYLTAQGKLLVIVAAKPDGTLMAPVIAHVLQNPCNLPVTNGTAVRYNWSPPATLNALLDEIRAVPPSPGANSGSPARS